MKLKIIILLIGLVLVSGCYSSTEFCKDKGYTHFSFITNEFSDERFFCYKYDECEEKLEVSDVYQNTDDIGDCPTADGEILVCVNKLTDVTDAILYIKDGENSVIDEKYRGKECQ